MVCEGDISWANLPTLRPCLPCYGKQSAIRMEVLSFGFHKTIQNQTYPLSLKTHLRSFSCSQGIQPLSKTALYCPQGSGTLRQQLLMMHGIAWYCMVLHGIAWCCMVLHGVAWCCMVLHGIAWYCMVALSCTILHLRYTCSQQMSPVVAFDIAVVAQKVKVQC